MRSHRLCFVSLFPSFKGKLGVPGLPGYPGRQGSKVCDESNNALC